MLQQLDTFVGPEVNWFALSPMLTLLGGTLVLMLAGALTPKWPKGLYAFATATIAGAAGVLAMVQWDDITDNGTRRSSVERSRTTRSRCSSRSRSASA
jgi:NADH-quinone oxidoreductase subunit N